jgi:GNAT superfamily N-acetyltransferase
MKGAMAVRKLRPGDLEDVIALDKAITGRSRRGYFEKRLAAALREPSAHVQFAVDGDRGLTGFVLARVLTGEYGRTEAALTLEVIDVDPALRRRGIGARLLAAIEDEMREKGITEILTEANWTDHELLRFLAAGGFALAPRQVLECAVAEADRL